MTGLFPESEPGSSCLAVPDQGEWHRAEQQGLGSSVPGALASLSGMPVSGRRAAAVRRQSLPEGPCCPKRASGQHSGCAQMQSGQNSPAVRVQA